jgi:two-component system, OmpR family, sensor histidine kinase BaeS
LNIRRIPIALRLFLTVLFTTLVITTVSLGVLHLNMQRNFTRYVADVEMQKLDHVIENLAEVYGVYNDWGNAIQAQILQIEGEAAPDDYDRLLRWWLRRQYDIALQQRYFQDHTLANVAPSLMGTDAEQRTVNEEELRVLAANLPSQFQPFEGLKFPLSSNQNLFRTDRKNGSQLTTQPQAGKKQY